MLIQRILHSLVVLAVLCAGLWTVEARDKKIVLIAGPPSHPSGMHEFNAGVQLLSKCLSGVPGVQTVFHLSGWPKETNWAAGADAVLFYMDGGGNHPAIQGDHVQTLRELNQRGVGIGCAHYAVEVPAGDPGKAWQDLIGGHYEHQFSVNPMWSPEFKSFPNHPITRGVQPFSVRDEWYFNLRFRSDMTGVTPILVATPSEQVRKGPYVWPAGPYPHIVAAAGREEIMMWAVENPGRGRGFGFTGGHVHTNWGNENFRKVVLNALLWIAHAEVPAQGVISTITDEDLTKNLDPKTKK